METKRMQDIDLLKGILIFCMIVGHVGFGGKVEWFIHAFHMQGFFIITGYLTTDTSLDLWEGVLQKKFRQLICPYLFFGVIGLLVNYFFITQDEFFSYVYSVCVWNTNGHMPIVGAIWFLTAMFFMLNTTIAIGILFKNRLRYLMELLLVMIVLLLNVVFDIRFPLAIDAAVVVIPFFEFGRLLRRYSALERISISNWRKKVLLCICTVLCLVLIFLNDPVNVRTADYGNIFLFYINGFFSTTILWCWCRIIIESSNLVVKAFCKYIKNIGKDSIIYLCMNQLVILVVNKCLAPFNISWWPIEHSICLAFVLLVLWMVSVLLKRSQKLKRLFFGRG